MKLTIEQLKKDRDIAENGWNHFAAAAMRKGGSEMPSLLESISHTLFLYIPELEAELAALREPVFSYEEWRTKTGQVHPDTRADYLIQEAETYKAGYRAGSAASCDRPPFLQTIRDVLLILGYTPGPDELIGQATIHKAIAERDAAAREQLKNITENAYILENTIQLLRTENADREKAKLIRCNDCGGTQIFKATEEGYLVFHSCVDGKQVREMFAASCDREKAAIAAARVDQVNCDCGRLLSMADGSGASADSIINNSNLDPLAIQLAKAFKEATGAAIAAARLEAFDQCRRILVAQGSDECLAGSRVIESWIDDSGGASTSTEKSQCEPGSLREGDSPT